MLCEFGVFVKEVSVNDEKKVKGKWAHGVQSYTPVLGTTLPVPL